MRTLPIALLIASPLVAAIHGTDGNIGSQDPRLLARQPVMENPAALKQEIGGVETMASGSKAKVEQKETSGASCTVTCSMKKVSPSSAHSPRDLSQEMTCVVMTKAFPS